MRKLNKILIVSLLAVFAMACDDDEPILYGSGDYVAFDKATSTLSENSGAAGIRLYRSGTDLSQALTVTFTISATYKSTSDFFDAGADASDAIETFGNSLSVEIPAGEVYATVAIYSVNDDLTSGDKIVTLMVTEAGGYNLGFPGPDGNRASHVLTIIDDDCPIPSFVGDLPVTTVVGSPGACGTVTSTVTVTLVSNNPDGSTTYSFSDVTGGHYPNCYGAPGNPGEIVVDGTSVILTAQPDVVYGSDQFDGSGTVNSCDGTFSLSWSNGFGDNGVSTYEF